MKVVFDLDAVIRNRYSGFYTFGSGLLKGMDSIKNPPRMILLYQKKLSFQAHELESKLGPWAITCPVRFKFRWLQNIWNFIPFPDINLFTGNYHLFHSFHHFMPPSRNRPAILTVHDLRRYVLPELYPASKTKKFEKAVQRADHFIAVSESTKQDLIKFFRIPEEKIDVVHLACNISPEQIDSMDRDTIRASLMKGLGTDHKRFLVAISSKDSRKNIPRIAEAFINAVNESRINDTALIILGRLPENMTLPKTGNIFNPGEVDDIMTWLACSSGLVFTSLYEGFGLPILEGFAAGVPVITSSISSMPEIAGDAALLVDPKNINSIKEAIKVILENKKIVNEKIQEGKARLSMFSWEQSAVKTVHIYSKVIARFKEENSNP